MSIANESSPTFWKKGREEFLERRTEFQKELEERIGEVDECFTFMSDARANGVTPSQFAKLSDFAAQEFVDGKGQRRSLLSPYELTLLTISRGNLDEAERREIESHVDHTLNFLRQIPWTAKVKIFRPSPRRITRVGRHGYPNNCPPRRFHPVLK